MADLSHIPDEAVTVAQEAGNHAYRDGADDATCWRLGLAAALIVALTACGPRDTQPGPVQTAVNTSAVKVVQP